MTENNKELNGCKKLRSAMLLQMMERLDIFSLEERLALMDIYGCEISEMKKFIKLQGMTQTRKDFYASGESVPTVDKMNELDLYAHKLLLEGFQLGYALALKGQNNDVEAYASERLEEIDNEVTSFKHVYKLVEEFEEEVTEEE